MGCLLPQPQRDSFEVNVDSGCSVDAVEQVQLYRWLTLCGNAESHTAAVYESMGNMWTLSFGDMNM